MTAPRGQAPLARNAANGHQVPAPRRSARTSAQAPAPIRAKASAGAGEPAAPKPGPPAILGVSEATGALRFLGRLALRHPRAVLRTAPGLGQELLRISRGRSQVAPERGDRRFTDPAWQQNPLFKATMQSYLTWGSGMDRYIDNLGLTGAGVERLRFGAVLLRESVAPTNFFATNPAAVKRCYDTGGGSIRRGLANWAGDLRHNHGMPSMVDRRPFTVGENLAATPGSVIYRDEVFELIQYTPQHGTVYERPILMVPPQVNKYYALDLSPGRSLYDYLLQRGFQVYGISWRNPTKEQRDRNFDTYVQATIDAIDAVREVSGSPDVNIMGGCLGGMTAALTQAHLAALGEEHRINSSTVFVTLLDTDANGRMFLFATPQILQLAKQVSRPAVLDAFDQGELP
jgi:polyhydroxyalkanoate synthase